MTTSNRPLLTMIAAAGVLLAVGAGTAPALVAQASSPQAQSRDDQGDARREMRAGNQLSLQQIERRILPRMRGSEYLGPSYDSQAKVYRLRFIRDGRVTFVDVDARTGRIINRR